TLYIITILFASLFHKTAVLVLFLPLFYNKYITSLIKQGSSAILLAIILVFVFKDYILFWIMNSGIVEAFGYQDYISNDFWNKHAELGTGLGFIAKLLTLTFIIIHTRKFLSHNTNNTPFILIILACLFSLSFSLSMNIFSRIERIYSIA